MAAQGMHSVNHINSSKPSSGPEQHDPGCWCCCCRAPPLSPATAAADLLPPLLMLLQPLLAQNALPQVCRTTLQLLPLLHIRILSLFESSRHVFMKIT